LVNNLLKLEKKLNLVHEYIPLVEARMREQSNGYPPDLQMALDHLLDSGGKRVRPTISLLVGNMIGAPKQRLVTVSAAVELLHTATLVHDDVIDGSLLRRGNPTLNARWSPGATILTGDFIFARAAKLAAETESIELMNMFAKTLSVIVSGEITQLFRSKGLASREDYEERIYAKTASLFEMAALAPAYLIERDEDLIESMKIFGYQVGMAFQIVDDILDFTSDQSELGKPVASDLRQGLVTLPALLYLEMVPDDPEMRQVLEDGDDDEALIEGLVKKIRESGAIDAALEEAGDYIRRGLAALNGMPDGKERMALEQMATYVVDRQL
jgi:geranylgeranyl pyrophosphate synthase